jgi:two-component system chemotaxis sensor kinase CheA
MLHGTPGMAGATITGDGRIALILDIPSLLQRYA